MVTADTTAASLSAEGLAALCQLIYQDSGIVLNESKRYLLEMRLKPVAEAHGLASLNQLSQLIRLDRALRRQTVEAMTTNESLFFRDTSPFEALRATIIPELLERRAQSRRLSIWCAACSSGQEPYSLAMLLAETVPQQDFWKIEILATDISEAMLGRARQGRFMQLEVNRGLPVQSLVKYFERDHLEWVLKPAIRAAVSFRQFNLMDDMRRLGPFDLVLCRNVLIYFDTPLKTKILAGIRFVLAPDGYLLLGSAETVFHLDEHYERKSIGKATFYQVV